MYTCDLRVHLWGCPMLDDALQRHKAISRAADLAIRVWRARQARDTPAAPSAAGTSPLKGRRLSGTRESCPDMFDKACALRLQAIVRGYEKPQDVIREKLVDSLNAQASSRPAKAISACRRWET